MVTTKKELILFILFLYFLTFIRQAEAKELTLYLDTSIPEKYKTIVPGEALLVPIDILVIKDDQERVDIIIEYNIKDKNGVSIVKLVETKSGIEVISTVQELRIPSGTMPGIYNLEITASPTDQSYPTAEKQQMLSFEVVHAEPAGESLFKSQLRSQLLYSSLLWAIFIIVLVTAFFMYWKIKHLERLLR